LREALSVMQRLFAPFLPFVTEEVWSWWQNGSVHRAAWPSAAAAAGDPSMLDSVGQVLAAVRRAKTEAKLSPKSPVDVVRVSGPPAFIAAVRAASADLCDAGNVARLEWADAPDVTVSVELPSAPAA
jgi:valyl-tRNA synthetase